MPTQSPMLNEILASAKGIAPGKYNDVSHIVSKYIPIGTSKEQTKIILKNMNQKYDETEDIIYAGYVGNNFPMVPNPRIFIELEYNHYQYLENITARYSYAQ